VSSPGRRIAAVPDSVTGTARHTEFGYPGSEHSDAGTCGTEEVTLSVRLRLEGSSDGSRICVLRA
jgi:hypothetical protein